MRLRRRRGADPLLLRLLRHRRAGRRGRGRRPGHPAVDHRWCVLNLVLSLIFWGGKDTARIVGIVGLDRRSADERPAHRDRRATSRRATGRWRPSPWPACWWPASPSAVRASLRRLRRQLEVSGTLPPGRPGPEQGSDVQLPGRRRSARCARSSSIDRRRPRHPGPGARLRDPGRRQAVVRPKTIFGEKSSTSRAGRGGRRPWSTGTARAHPGRHRGRGLLEAADDRCSGASTTTELASLMTELTQVLQGQGDAFNRASGADACRPPGCSSDTLDAQLRPARLVRPPSTTQIRDRPRAQRHRRQPERRCCPTFNAGPGRLRPLPPHPAPARRRPGRAPGHGPARHRPPARSAGTTSSGS